MQYKRVKFKIKIKNQYPSEKNIYQKHLDILI